MPRNEIASEGTEETVVVSDEDTDVQEDWMNLQLPPLLTEDTYTMEIELTQPFQDVDIVWRHPSNIESDVHTLTEFVPGTSQAEYTVDVRYGNLLPGVNTYEIFAREDDEEPGEGLSTTVSLEYSFDGQSELSPEMISFSNLLDRLDAQEYELTATVAEAVSKIEVSSYHKESGKATFAELKQFTVGDEFMRYVVGESLGNLFYGENRYMLEAFGTDGALVSRQLFTIRSDYLSLQAQVQQIFGNFSKNDEGWYISELLPWFSLRPVPESFAFEPNDQSVVMPRPTLMYPHMASPETPLCDFLSGIDYEQDDYSYRGYSFETCQQYRFGIAVYDRFLSLLKFSPLEVVRRVEYDAIRDSASSAFVMIETAGMPSNRLEDLSFEDLIPVEEETEEPTSEETEVSLEESSADTPELGKIDDAPRYYVFQMLITEDTQYTDKKIGEIVEEASEERLADIERIRTLLTAHGGNALFTEMLFTGANAIDPIKQEGEEDAQATTEE